MRRLLIATTVLAAAVVFFVGRSLPPRRLTLANPSPDGTIPGVLHVHSVRSDGRGTVDDIAQAAARAGLKFVVFTDHGDATRPPDPPAYRAGVLCLDGVEVSTTGGHYVAIDMPAAPYPLGGEARDVVEDVKRLGGFGIAAHPDSPKQELRWREWIAPFDAVEILNPDTSWRRWMAAPSWRSRLRLVEALFAYPIRPAEAIANLLQPSDVRYQWEALAARRRVVTIAGADAHANIELRSTEPGETRFALPLPSYEASFRAFSIHVRADRDLTGEAPSDAATIVRAIRSGHLYTAVDGLAGPASFDVTATSAEGTAHPGDQLTAAGPVTLHVRSNAPREFTATVWSGTTVLSTDRREPEFSVQMPGRAGVYWVEIDATDRRPQVPWVTSNAIYVRNSSAPTSLPARPPARLSQPLFNGRSASGWRVEHDGLSLAAVDVARAERNPELRLRFGLGGGTPAGQYAALGVDTPNGVAPNDRLAFTVRAERPMRISVQLRAGSARWQRSVYVDTSNEDRTVYFDDLAPIGVTETWKPPFADVRTILFVVDLTNTKPGTSGWLWISQPVLQR